ncbi:acyltransferase family protein [Asticcacaulis benevestitus]|uniref:Acyltransferase 3 domain-containing protein n=1 Tax=Asticcacaulis benevestitus DSM 16100 = ATCC BAA-896 TaxID=1121022 RepID=V4PV52_9CAUL|nr:acyltransferase [Asticcacaulis benevestitus]ESQ89455.1 hypothetical protein ABENE_13835 [Asticcacaulis benevestitus DSM 16100 = ATCC BAA-896]
MYEILTPTATTERSYTLDAMRGVAALLVVSYHFCGVVCPIEGHGYLAVDFFFILSGLVVSMAYSKKLSTTLFASEFIVKRFIRLWPLFAIGLCFALVKPFAQMVLNYPGLGPEKAIVAFSTEIFMLPSFVNGVELFPLNGPAWSLFFEIAINIVFGLWLFKAKPAVLVVIGGGAGICLAMAAAQAGTLNIGWGWDTFLSGVFRVTFGFICGIILEKLGVGRQSGKPSYWCLVPIGVLAAVLMLKVPPILHWQYDLIIALLVSPMLVAVGARWQPPFFLKTFFKFLGDISFPIYAVHFSLIYAWAFIARKLLDLPSQALLPVFLAFIVGLAWVLIHIDARVRRLLFAGYAALKAKGSLRKER